MGSPPRGRGKDPLFAPPASLSRITPAWAGKRKQLGRKAKAVGDHPRVGGEKPGFRRCIHRFLGSPPRGRGKVFIGAFPVSAIGITPAWAGKRIHTILRWQNLKDHPRVGGEKMTAENSALLQMGSPPRGRGKVDDSTAHTDPVGITPAWAGKSRSGRWSGRMSKDHPRVGGEKLINGWTAGIMPGSPPRGRGKVISLLSGLYSLRITPAWAGKSDACCPVLSLSEDHPRVGGEKKYRKGV